MCGIAGMIGSQVSSRIVAEMVGAIRHRGPDSDGFYTNEVAAVGVRRLSIVDICGGDQPFITEDGRLALVFNGEIYNYRELRDELVGRGHRFRSTSDSEVVLHLYEEHGPACFQLLRGMYSFAIVSNHEVILVRDKMGIKPLYYAVLEAEGHVLFGSEIKAILQHPAIRPSINVAAITDRQILQYIPGESTALQEVSLLAPGCFLRVATGGAGLKIAKERYHRNTVCNAGDIALEQAISGFRGVFTDAVSRHLQGDVRVGLTLSGGLDSTLLGRTLVDLGVKDLATYTIGASLQSGDSVLARNIAATYGFEHHDIHPSFEEYIDAIPMCVLAEESVPSLYALPFLLMSRSAAARLKVCLNGEGADELFGGYPEYTQQVPTVHRLRSNVKAMSDAGLPISDQAREIVDRLTAPQSYDAYFNELLLINQGSQLDYNHLVLLDHYSMACSLEIRVPFLDDEVVKLVNSLPPQMKVNKSLVIGKYMLKHLALRNADQFCIDSAIRPKAGMPSSCYSYLNRLISTVDRNVSDEYARSNPYYDVYCRRDKETGAISGKLNLLLHDLFETIYIANRGLPVDSLRFEDVLAEASGPRFEGLHASMTRNVVETV